MRGNNSWGSVSYFVSIVKFQFWFCGSLSAQRWIYYEHIIKRCRRLNKYWTNWCSWVWTSEVMLPSACSLKTWVEMSNIKQLKRNSFFFQFSFKYSLIKKKGEYTSFWCREIIHVTLKSIITQVWFRRSPPSRSLVADTNRFIKKLTSSFISFHIKYTFHFLMKLREGVSDSF